MPDDVVHLMVRMTPTGLYVTSPQAPGLAYGCADLAELRATVDDVLAFHFDRPGPFPVVEHHERHYVVAGRELVTRLAVDEHREARQEVYSRLGRALAVPEQARSLVDGTTNMVGETVYVCAVPSDTMEWLAAQLDPRGDALTVAVAIADPFVFTVPFASGDGIARIGSVGLDSEELTPDSTVGDIVRQTPIVQPRRVHGTTVG